MTTPTPIPPAILAEAKRQHAILSHGVAAIYPSTGVHGPDGLFDKLVQALQENRPLKIKLGADPTRPDLHIGHGIVLESLKKFQALGHMAQFLIGGYTTRIGDPTGRNTTRPPLTPEEIKANSATYMQQVFTVLNNDPATVCLMNNEDWLANLSFADLLKLCGQVTVAQIIQREDFANRLASNTAIGLHELLYPIMQGFDSIAMECDIELGGTDQTFNCLMGRQLMHARGMSPQIVITFPLLEGLDGVEKMSKSKDNYIGLAETPNDMYGKTMSIPDTLIHRWYDLLTTVPASAREADPYKAKRALAKLITARYHGEAEADKAEAYFTQRFSEKKMDVDAPVISLTAADLALPMVDFLVAQGAAKSKSDARRLIEQKGVKLDGIAVTDGMATLANLLTTSTATLTVGKLFMRKLQR
ncbi:MAG: tyrosine--tRNA ligase [Alphaproteobacteria bacterium]